MERVFDFRELSGYADFWIKKAQKEMPKETNKFLNQEGTKLKKKVAAKAKQRVGKRTGRYYKGWKKGKIYTYKGNGGRSVRVYNAAPHSGILEAGRPFDSLRGGMRCAHVLRDATEEFEAEYREDLGDFVDNVVRQK